MCFLQWKALRLRPRSQAWVATHGYLASPQIAAADSAAADLQRMPVDTSSDDHQRTCFAMRSADCKPEQAGENSLMNPVKDLHFISVMDASFWPLATRCTYQGSISGEALRERGQHANCCSTVPHV